MTENKMSPKEYLSQAMYIDQRIDSKLQQVTALRESAKIDGANEWIIMLRIYVPTSLPSIATITLFAFVYHWNSWFDGLLYNNDIANYPLQTYLQVILTNKAPSSIDESMVNIGRNMKAAQIFVTMLPLLAVYPFLQKYFVTGMVIGSVKG